MKFGQFEVEYDPEAGSLVVVNTLMQHQLHIGYDQIDILDLESNHIESWELPV